MSEQAIRTIDLEGLQARESQLRKGFEAGTPFRYLVIDDFLRPDAAYRLHEEFPAIDRSTWHDASDRHTRRKWSSRCMAGTFGERYYAEANGDEFREFLARLTGIPALIADPNLLGAGYHQIEDGGYLDVHVDFNRHHSTGLDRRLNLLVYLNPGWQERDGGCLELWDMGRRVQVATIVPAFNRAVLFETNDVSFHGHPRPVSTGGRTTRKSLSVYYYTRGRDDLPELPGRNTIYVNTQGLAGGLRTLLHGASDLVRRATRRLR